MSTFLAAWFVETALITYRGFKGGATAGPINGLPLPADYVGETVIFGALSLLANTGASRFGAVFAWGLVVATALNLWTPNHPGAVKPTVKKPAAKVPVA